MQQARCEDLEDGWQSEPEDLRDLPPEEPQQPKQDLEIFDFDLEDRWGPTAR